MDGIGDDDDDDAGCMVGRQPSPLPRSPTRRFMVAATGALAAVTADAPRLRRCRQGHASSASPSPSAPSPSTRASHSAGRGPPGVPVPPALPSMASMCARPGCAGLRPHAGLRLPLLLHDARGRCFATSASRPAARDSLRNRSVLMYALAGTLLAGAVTYASVPLYKMFCRVTGYGGTTARASAHSLQDVEPIRARRIRVHFNADRGASMRWKFQPQQRELVVVPGEAALAFYKATNPSSEPVVGISTYNVIPFEAGQYFNKIQCFCFEEQRLDPGETVDLPVFFYIDSAFDADPALERVNDITLSYTFFEARDTSASALAARTAVAANAAGRAATPLH